MLTDMPQMPPTGSLSSGERLRYLHQLARSCDKPIVQQFYHQAAKDLASDATRPSKK